MPPPSFAVVSSVAATSCCPFVVSGQSSVDYVAPDLYFPQQHFYGSLHPFSSNLPPQLPTESAEMIALRRKIFQYHFFALVSIASVSSAIHVKL